MVILQKRSHLKDISSVKLFVSLFLSCIFYFAAKITTSWFPLIESLKIIWKVPNPTFGSWIIIKLRGFGLFFLACLTQIQSNNCDLFKAVKKSKQDQFWIAQNEHQLWTALSRKMTNLKIYASLVTKKLETSNLDSR